MNYVIKDAKYLKNIEVSIASDIRIGAFLVSLGKFRKPTALLIKKGNAYAVNNISVIRSEIKEYAGDNAEIQSFVEIQDNKDFRRFYIQYTGNGSGDVHYGIATYDKKTGEVSVMGLIPAAVSDSTDEEKSDNNG